MRPHRSSWYLVIAAIGVAAPLQAGVLDDVQKANSNLNALVQDQGANNGPVLQSALAKRSALITQLIVEDPQAVTSVRLPPDLVDGLKRYVPAAAIVTGEAAPLREL